MADHKPILELSTLEPERPRIKIDKDYYELSVMEDFGLREQHWFTSRGRKINDALSAEDLDDHELAMLEETLDEYVRRLVRKLKPEVLARLNFSQRVEIIQVFGQAAGVRPQTVPEGTSTGESLSPDSSDSMVGTPSGG